MVHLSKIRLVSYFMLRVFLIIIIGFSFLFGGQPYSKTGVVQAQSELNGVAGKKVTLDAGHGWNGDSGAVGSGMKEKDVTIDIVLRTKAMLEAYGIVVSLTRTGDVPGVGLSAAAQRANSYGSDLDVSVHTNGSVNATGTESCYQVNHPRSADSQRLAQLLTNEVSSQLGLRKRGDFPENDGGRCARSNTTHWTQLYIHSMNMPAAIIETAFINGQSQDVDALRNRRDVFARAITHAIVRYLGGDPNNVDEPDNRTLTLQEILSGKINIGGDTDSFTFSGSAGQSVVIEMTRTDGSIDPFVTLYRPGGAYLTYDDDSAGSQNARITVTLPDNGQYRLIAKSYGTSQSGGYTVVVKNCTTCGDIDPRWLSNGVALNGSIQPASEDDTYYISAARGQVLDVTMNRSGSNGLDSYLELYDPSGSWVASNDDGGGSQNSRMVVGLNSSGVFRIKARSYNRATSGNYVIRAGFIQADNLALRRGSYATSTELTRYSAEKAFDGNLETRWSSSFADQQGVYVDLGSVKQFDSVVLRWETAYGRKYGIYVWVNNTWQNVFYTNNGRGGTTNIQFAPVNSRYVMMYGFERGTQWGYSLWEFEVYNAAALIMPIVPPDPNEKPGDLIDEIAPLPLPEDSGGKDLLALYLGDGETAQEVMALNEPEPIGVTLSLNIGQQGLPIATIVSVSHLLNGEPLMDHAESLPLAAVFNFIGEAADTDYEGDADIVAYEWTSSLDGRLSSKAEFSVAVTALSPGEHTLTFRAKDNEGNWSEVDTYQFNVPEFERIFIPIIRGTNTPSALADMQLQDAGQWGVQQAAYAQSNFPTTPTLGQQNYYIGQDYLNGQWNKGYTRLYFQPQFPGLPAGSSISKAAINLYLYAKSCSSNFTVDLYEVAGGWGSSLTWNNQPSRGSYIGSMTMTCSTGWKEINITETAKRWYGGAANNGVLMIASPESARGAAFRSNSCSTSQCPGQEHPYFRVEYTTPPPTYSISGRLVDSGSNSISGATLSIQGGPSTTTDGNGNYNFSGLTSGSYVLVPAKSGYTFIPGLKTVSLPPNQGGIDFTGSLPPPTYRVSGKISDGSGVGIAGVTINAGGVNVVSDSNGSYTLSGLTANTYTLTPAKTDYIFSPASRSLSVPPAQEGQNFTGAPKPANDTWTMMIYMAGDNNLFQTLEQSLERLENMPSNPKVRVLVLFDNRNKNDTWRFNVQPGIQYIDNVNRWYLGEKNTGDPQTLQEFMQWGFNNYPSDHTYLAIADHGRGTSGIANDDNSNQDLLTPAELRSVLSIVTNSGQKKLDIVHFDACLMGMVEVAYDLRAYSNYMIASENLGWSAFAYELYTGASDASPRTFATNIASLYFNHPRLSNHPRTIAVLDLSKAQSVQMAVNTLAAAMRSNMNGVKGNLQNARLATQKFDSTDYYRITDADEYLDLYHLADRLQNYVQNSSIQTAAQHVKDAIQSDGFVVANYTYSATYGSVDAEYWDLSNAHGVSIYFPPRPGSNAQGDYQRYISHHSFSFTQDTQWDEFLADYFGVLGLPPVIEPLPAAPPMLEPDHLVYLPGIRR